MCESVVQKCFVATDQGRREYMEDFVCMNLSRQQSLNKMERNGNVTVRCKANNLMEYFAVFDGHGGCDAATFAQNHLFDEIKKQTGFWSQDRRSVSRAIVDGFVSTSKAMWNVIETWPRARGGRLSTAGTTASIVLIRDQMLYVANVGDSSVVLGERAANGCCIAKMLTVDHKPDLDDERKRIENEGGDVMEKGGIQRVVWKRPVFGPRGTVCSSSATEKIPFLAISRALGDLWSYNVETDAYVVSPKPDVTAVNIDKNHCFLILATDGLWHVVEPSQAVNIVARLTSNMISSSDDTSCPAAVLVQLALRKWAESGVKADNISVIVVLFQNCKSLESSALKDDYSYEEDRLAMGVHSVSSLSNTVIRNPVRPSKNQIYKTCRRKKLHMLKRKPLSSISNVQNQKCGSVMGRKHKFKIPTTPEQRSAYWSHRKLSKMIETLPLDLDSFVTKRSVHKLCMQF